MKSFLFSLSAIGAACLLSSCAGVKVVDTQVASGAVKPSAIYIRPFSTAESEFTGSHSGGGGEQPIRQSLAGREFANALRLQLEKLAPAMVIENDERPDNGWLIDGSLDVVDGGSRWMRGALPGSHLGLGRSQVVIHVRVRGVNDRTAASDKDASKLGRKGDVLYEFDLSGGSRATGRAGSITAPGMGPATPFDFKNAAERVMIALSTDAHQYGKRTAATIR